MDFFKMLSSFFDDDQYRRNPIPQNLTEDQLAALSVGAINAEQTSAYWDSLTTGKDPKELKENLADNYGIDDRTSALETMDWLRGRGHRVYFEALKDLASGTADRLNADGLEEEELPRLGEYFSHLQEATADLTEEGFLTRRRDLARHSIAAWDMGRLVLVARCCFDAGYIAEEEAWRYIVDAQAECKKRYSTWRELACGYLIGRAMWSGSGMTLDGLMGIADDLLEDDESPWNAVSF